MAASSGASASAAPPGPPVIQNIDIRVPKNHNKKLAIMRFNAAMSVDFTKWTQTKMERENNKVTFKSFTEDMPKFGAGSEYGREAREEARRKKYGIISKKYNPENQPWILQYGPKTERKKIRGVREGGVTENASYYVFTQAPDGVFEAFPVQEWYNFQNVQNYKALSYEEAEEEFTSRNRTFNLFNVMVRKRMKKNDEDVDDDGEEEGEGKGKGKKKKSKKGDKRFGDEFDEMMESSGGDSSDGDDDKDDEDKKSKKKNKKPVKPKKKRKNGSDDEPLEDSDDGDGEGRELDYISSSDEESDRDVDAKDELKGVAEEDALRKLLNSDEEDEDEENKDEDKDKEEEEDGADEKEGDKAGKDDEKKKKKKSKKDKDGKRPRKEEYGSSSESNGESSDSELEKAKPSPKPKPGSANSSRSATPTKPLTSLPESDSKRKMPTEVSAAQAAKKARLDLIAANTSSAASTSSAAASSSANEGVNEESVRRYLSRKPMTTTELLQKFKSKKTGLSSDQLVHHIAQILKKINPVKQMIKGKMYLSLKA